MSKFSLYGQTLVHRIQPLHQHTIRSPGFYDKGYKDEILERYGLRTGSLGFGASSTATVIMVHGRHWGWFLKCNTQQPRRARGSFPELLPLSIPLRMWLRGKHEADSLGNLSHGYLGAQAQDCPRQDQRGSSWGLKRGIYYTGVT